MTIHHTSTFIRKNISIVIQGAITKKNISKVASHCAHWRNILPNSEIILSISTTDCLVFEDASSKTPLIKNIINNPQDDYTILPAINTFKNVCDYILFNEKSTALSLPPIKDDTRNPNNINYLIESSYNGLSVVSKTYTLRIRNDAVFLNSNFIDLYCSNHAAPRRPETTFFQQRVLVPWIYTLNPYSDERLPLHISDWLNFGLTKDVKKIWDIPPYTFQDAVFFEKNKPKFSNISERHFNLRLAVEQYIYIQCFQKVYPSLKIDYLNDLSSRELCMDIILDNFYIFSHEEFSLRISKHYQKELTNPRKRSACLTEDAWRFMVLNRSISYAEILHGDVDKNIQKVSKGNFKINIFKIQHSPLHEGRNICKKIVFYIYCIILSKNKKQKFLYRPEYFFKDSKSWLTRKIGSYYIGKVMPP